jgi:hypothetical protein
MKKLSFVLVLAVGAAAAIAGCGGGGSGLFSSLVAAAIAPSFGTAPAADLTGQTNIYTGTLGSGTTATFTAINGVAYVISAGSSPANENLIVDIFDENGNELDSKTITTNGGLGYLHQAPNEHVLVLLRPYDPLNTSVNITSFQITAGGPYSTTSLSINLIVAGDTFTGFGNYNDLQTPTDRNNFAAYLGQQVQALHDANSTGITFTFGGYSLSTAQIQAGQPSLIDANGLSIAATQQEQVNSQGYGVIDTAGIDLWGTFGFPNAAPSTPAQANGLDCFVIHHFTTDGVVGLSPRPGTAIQGNGPGTALCIGAFLQENGQISGPRDPADMAVVLTHEIGHFLGLQHTTTFSPSASITAVTQAIDDGLSDTPPAGNLPTLIANAKANGHTAISIGDGCGDENYIMFYQAKPTGQTLFSPMQKKIITTTLSCLPH